MTFGSCQKIVKQLAKISSWKAVGVILYFIFEILYFFVFPFVLHFDS